MNIEDNFKEIRQKIKEAAEKSGRRADSVKIVAVSKSVHEERFSDAYQGA
jgi:uncharacterized pyridoxal phosphate-containing UPF0001 family protein